MSKANLKEYAITALVAIVAVVFVWPYAAKPLLQKIPGLGSFIK
jgi:hypothetical protein